MIPFNYFVRVFCLFVMVPLLSCPAALLLLLLLYGYFVFQLLLTCVAA